ncbi:MAG TPA: hypothetical protein VGK91_09300, partial [Candidatus Udaeobacter sp.]
VRNRRSKKQNVVIRSQSNHNARARGRFPPVTFHYQKDIDPDAKSQFGRVAEEVERVNSD